MPPLCPPDARNSWLPVWLVMAGAFVSLAGFGGLMATLVHLESEQERLVDERQHVSESAQALRELHESLGASAALAVATDELSWRKRYARQLTGMEAALERFLVRGRKAEPQSATELRAAQDALGAISAAALAHLDQGRTDAAIAHMAGPEFQLGKRRFSSALERLARTLRAAAGADLAALRSGLRAWILVGTTFLAALAIAWAALVSRLRRDVDDQRRIEAELSAERDTAQRALAARSRFLAHMSHEVRTPMNGVLGMCQLLDDSELDEEQRDTLDVIRTSGESLLTVLDDILDFSKIEAGQLEIGREAFDLRRCVTDVVALLAFRAREKGLHLRHRIDADLPPYLQGDATRVRQVVTNLVSNAVKFTQHGGVEVAVLAERLPDGIVNVLIEVRDTGVGIASQNLDLVFAEFAQLNMTHEPGDGGTGLGLAITRQLVELMGGRIGVESDVGRGTTFRVLLPLVIEGAQKGGDGASPHRAPESAPPSPRAISPTPGHG